MTRMGLSAAMIAGLWMGAMTSAWALEPEQQARYQSLVHQLRCLVCQNQSIAESNADLANDLRVQVRTQIEAGRSDQEILDYMSDRYGDFVLYKPPLERKTIVLWVGPFLILLLAAFIAWRSGRRTAKSEPSAPDQERLRRLLERENP